MESTSLTALVDTQLAIARTASSGRSAHTLYGGQGHHLRQTVLVLLEGQSLADHESPGEATLQVLRGRLRVTTADENWEGTVGDHLALPLTTHGVLALEECALLLTVAVDTRE